MGQNDPITDSLVALDMTVFEAQDASDIVTNAATGDVNIILGTSINGRNGR